MHFLFGGQCKPAVVPSNLYLAFHFPYGYDRFVVENHALKTSDTQPHLSGARQKTGLVRERSQREGKDTFLSPSDFTSNQFLFLFDCLLLSGPSSMDGPVSSHCCLGFTLHHSPPPPLYTRPQGGYHRTIPPKPQCQCFQMRFLSLHLFVSLLSSLCTLV